MAIKILDLLEKKPYSKEKLIDLSGFSRATITRLLKELKDKGRIERVGSDKTGYYRVAGKK